MKTPKKKRKFIALFITMIVMIVLTGTLAIFAKYHSIQAQKGVATASEIYFSSNYLEQVQGDECVTKYNTSRWDGDQSLFHITLRNYENRLLYNNSIDLVCDVSFQLVQEPTDGLHYIVYAPADGAETQELTSTSQVITVHNITIPAGSANEAAIDLGIMRDSGVVLDHMDSDEVIVTAYIISPIYAQDLGPLQAKLKATTSNEAFRFTSGFKISEDIGDADLQRVYNASGFVYNLDTSGGTGKEEICLRISWDNRLFDLNQFDELYTKDKLSAKTEGTISYIDFKPILNAHREFIFYKTDQFTKDELVSKTQFEQLVKIQEIE